MRHLFEPAGQRALEAVMRRQPLAAFDFDGTINSMDEGPDDMLVADPIADCMRQLARLCPVAIVTGHAVEDVARRLCFEPHFIVGSHGAEGPTGHARGIDASMLDGIRARLTRHAAELQAAGVHLEDKGLSLAFHYRLAADRTLAASRIDELLDGIEESVRVFGDKCVVNVVPADAPDKADAMVGLVLGTGSRAAVFVGDDVNDEPVYARAPSSWLTVRIGRDDPSTLARFFVNNHDEVETMLRTMIALLAARAARGSHAASRRHAQNGRS